MVNSLGVGPVDCELRFYCLVSHGGDAVERCASDAYETAYAEDTDGGCFGEFVGRPVWVTARSPPLTFCVYFFSLISVSAYTMVSHSIYMGLSSPVH